MKRTRAHFYKCAFCNHEEPRWLGRCPDCGEWNTLEETLKETLKETFVSPASRLNQYDQREKRPIPQSFPLTSINPMDEKRICSGIEEFDRTLGGGIMKRSAILLGGEPGIGKSTLLFQIAAAAKTQGRILYVSGEESAGQVRMRADRLGTENHDLDRIELCCTGSLEAILSILDAVKPTLIMIDSVQTLYHGGAGSSAPGAINQMNICVYELITWVKERDAAIFLAAHVTKDGLISGPKTLEHLVDTVLYFEQGGNPGETGNYNCRFIRAVKNRFGSVDEIGIFTMSEKGLIAVKNPSLLFLVTREREIPAGIAIAAVLEGSRSLLVEIQALTIPAKGSLARIFSGTIEINRISRIAASLEKYLGLRLSDQDLYVNVAGGMRINEVGIELALAAALYSAKTGIALPAKTAIAGELSLAGEILPVRRQEIREKTAAGLGFSLFLAGDLKNAINGLFGLTRI